MRQLPRSLAQMVAGSAAVNRVTGESVRAAIVYPRGSPGTGRILTRLSPRENFSEGYGEIAPRDPTSHPLDRSYDTIPS